MSYQELWERALNLRLVVAFDTSINIMVLSSAKRGHGFELDQRHHAVRKLCHVIRLHSRPQSTPLLGR
jgi:hypothetical protein